MDRYVEGYPDHVRVLAGWVPVQIPFRSLRGGLTEVERRLNDSPTDGPPNRWRRLREAVGDEQAGLLAVNDLSSALLGGWQLAKQEAGHWRVVLVPASGADPTELAALQALVLLVEAGGWARLGRCARPGCPAVFLDATSGGNQRTCRAHQRSR